MPLFCHVLLFGYYFVIFIGLLSFPVLIVFCCSISFPHIMCLLSLLIFFNVTSLIQFHILSCLSQVIYSVLIPHFLFHLWNKLNLSSSTSAWDERYLKKHQKCWDFSCHNSLMLFFSFRRKFRCSNSCGLHFSPVWSILYECLFLTFQNNMPTNKNVKLRQFQHPIFPIITALDFSTSTNQTSTACSVSQWSVSSYDVHASTPAPVTVPIITHDEWHDQQSKRCYYL